MTTVPELPEVPDNSDLLADRYGRRTSRGRLPLVPILLGLVVVVPFLAWLAWVVWTYSTPAVQSQMVNFAVAGEHTVVAEIEVTLADDATDASCRIIAVAEDKVHVGEEQFVPTDGRNHVEITTERKATSAELVGCTAEGQLRSR